MWKKQEVEAGRSGVQKSSPRCHSELKTIHETMSLKKKKPLDGSLDKGDLCQAR